MFPLSTVLFPYDRLHLHVFEPRYRAWSPDCLAGDGRFGVVLISRGSEVGGGDERVDGGDGRLDRERRPAGPTADGISSSPGLGLLRVTRWLDDDPYPRALVEPWRLGPGHRRRRAARRAESSSGASSALLSELGEARRPRRRPRWTTLPTSPVAAVRAGTGHAP